MEDDISYFDKTLKKIEFIYRLSGINIKSGERKSSDRIKSRCIFIINFLWLNTDLAGAIAWVIDGILGGKDLLNLTPIAPCIFIATLGNMKGIFLILKENYVHKLIDNMRELDKKAKTIKMSVKKNLIVEKELKLLNFVLNTIMISYTTLLFTFASSPLVIMAAKYYKENELNLVLPFLILYPFDPLQLKVWPFVYFHQMGTEVAVSLEVCAADFFFLTCCTYIRIQFRLLRHEIENMIPIQGPNQTFLEDKEFRDRFREIVNWHQDIIESANLLETIFSKSTLINFVISSMVICFTGFNVTKDVEAVEGWSKKNRFGFNVTKCKALTFSRLQRPIISLYTLDCSILERVNDIHDLGLLMDSRLNFREHITAVCKNASKTLGFIMRTASQFRDMVNDTAFVVTFVCFLILSLVQIFFLCYFADLLMTSSMEISDAVYHSQWYTAESKVAKLLLIMQIRSQVPCKLTASGFADVSLNSFMRILSTSWSYFALLQTMYAN